MGEGQRAISSEPIKQVCHVERKSPANNGSIVILAMRSRLLRFLHYDRNDKNVYATNYRTLSCRAKSRMERLGEPRHGREGRRLSEREVSESHLWNQTAASWPPFTKRIASSSNNSLSE